MARKLDFSYVNNSGKKVSGAAAFNHYVYTEKGSVQNYNDEVGAEYILQFIRQNSDNINKDIEKKVRRSRIKVV